MWALKNFFGVTLTGTVSLQLENRIARQEKAKTSLLKTAPNEYERNVIHDIFLKTIDEK